MEPLAYKLALFDTLLPPARVYHWQVLTEPPALRYPVKPYKWVSRSTQRVLDAENTLFYFRVEKGRITQWSTQFQYSLEKNPPTFWQGLSKKQRTRIRLNWEKRQMRAYQQQLRLGREQAILLGHF